MVNQKLLQGLKGFHGQCHFIPPKYRSDQNVLKFNDDKTTLILLWSHDNFSKVGEIEIAIGDHKVKP